MASGESSFLTSALTLLAWLPLLAPGAASLAQAETQSWPEVPWCFPEGSPITADHCCSLGRFPDDDQGCWDSLRTFDLCCRAPLTPPPPNGRGECFHKSLRGMHEFCCGGRTFAGLHRAGPRGFLGCWLNALFEHREILVPAVCCGQSYAWDWGEASARGHGRGPSCLAKGHATTCSHPELGVFFTPLVPGKFDPVLNWGSPVLAALPAPRGVSRPVAHMHFLTLGVGNYAKSVDLLLPEARALGVFGQVHAYKGFDFIQPSEEARWSRHLRAWRVQRARIAGYGWWKPVICRRHLTAPTVPPRKGLVVFSDAGSRLLPESQESWTQLAWVMRKFDIMAVLDSEVLESSYTKERTLRHFERALAGTQAAFEGQFITGLFVMRRTQATLRLLDVWERLIEDISLVDESAQPRLEHSNFVTHRHEQSVWSLLLKCSILGRPLQVRARGPLENVTARILVVTAVDEAVKLADFARRGSERPSRRREPWRR